MVLLLWLWSSLAFAAGPVTLADYLSEVESNYPSLAAARARAASMESRVSPAGAWDDPFFAMGIDQMPTKGMDTTSVWRYQLSQTIPFPGKRGSKGRAAEEAANGAKADAESFTRELTLIATQLFYRTYYIGSALETNEAIRKVLGGTIVSSQARYKTGGGGHHEWLLARAELSVLNVESLRLQRELKLLHARMNEMRGQPSGAKIGELKPGFTEGKAAEANLKNQPELKAFDAAVAAADAEATAAKMAYAPDFVVQGMLMKPKAMPAEGMGAPMQSNWGFMVGINVPLYFAWKQAPLVTAARHDKEAAVLERRSLENRLSTEVVDAQEQLKTARSIVELYKTSVIPSTKLAAGNARTAYAAKRFPLSQYLDILKSERTQELELLAARIDVEIAAARLENLLSAPPIAKFAPARPSLFGGMGSGMGEMPEAASMGKGTIGPKKSKTSVTSPGAGGGMEGM